MHLHIAGHEFAEPHANEWDASRTQNGLRKRNYSWKGPIEINREYNGVIRSIHLRRLLVDHQHEAEAHVFFFFTYMNVVCTSCFSYLFFWSRPTWRQPEQLPSFYICISDKHGAARLRSSPCCPQLFPVSHLVEEHLCVSVWNTQWFLKKLKK